MSQGKSKGIVVVLLIAIVVTFFWGDGQVAKLEKELSASKNKLELAQVEFEDYKNRSAETISEKNKEITLKENTISSLESQASILDEKVTNLEATTLSLEAEVNKWQDRYTQAYSALESTSKQLQEAASELDYLRDLTSQAYSDLRSLFSWVKDNAYLDSKTHNSANSQCGNPTAYSGNDCVIDTFKLGEYMANCFSYASEEDQKISSCDEFWGDRRGDCDDYALFAAAWLRSEIEDSGRKCSTTWISMQNKADSQCGTYGCYRKKQKASPDEIFVVCGGLSKSAAALFNEPQGSGHCEVGISSYSPFSPNSEEHLKKMNIFEPQSGTYNGKLESEFSELHAIITNDDIIFYDGWNVDYQLTDIKDDYEDFMDEYEFN